MRALWAALLSALLLVSVWLAAGRVSAQPRPAAGHGCPPRATITYMFWGNKNDKAAQDAGVKLAESRCPGLHVNEIWDPNSYDTDLPAKIAAGRAPDLFQLDGAKRIPEYVSRHALLPLDSLVKQDRLEVNAVFWQQCIRAMSVGHHLYGLPRTCGNQSLLYYNQEMFDARHVKYPTNRWTYRDFARAAKQLSGRYAVPNDPVARIRFGYAWNPDDFRTEQYMWNWGGDWLSAGLNRCELTSRASRAGLQWWHDLRYRVHGTPTATQSLGLPDYFVGFQKEDYAMSFMGAWALDYAFGKTPDTTPLVHFPWNAVLNPTGPRNRQAVMTGTAEVIYRKSRHVKAAWWLMRFLTDGPGGVYVGIYGVDTPGAKAWWRAPAVRKEFGSVLTVAQAANQSGRYPRLVAQYDRFWSIVSNDLQPLWQDQESVQAATSRACADLRGVLR